MATKSQSYLLYLGIALLFGLLFWYLHEDFFEITGFHSAYHYSTPQQSIPPLPSGWDVRAEEYYKNETARMHKVMHQQPEAMRTVRTKLSGPVAYFDDTKWARRSIDGNPPKWEPRTFELFSKVLPHSTHYVGFGTWRGPTLLYATQYVDMALGIEADPVAFAQVHFNLALNQDKPWAKHTFLQNAAVGAISGADIKDVQNLEMHSAVAGSSCAGLGKVFNCGNKRAEDFQNWNVNAYSFLSLLRHYDIPVAATTFIKIDVESYECDLLPVWADWLFSLKPNDKPSLYIAFHAQVQKCSVETYKLVTKLAGIYNHVDCGAKECSVDGIWTAIDNIEVLFSDHSLSHFSLRH